MKAYETMREITAIELDQVAGGTGCGFIPGGSGYVYMQCQNDATVTKVYQNPTDNPYGP